MERTFMFADDPSTVVYYRNYLIDMLVKFHLENKFDIGCFTAGTQDYAEPILRDIERRVHRRPELAGLPQRPLFAVKKYRHDCTLTDRRNDNGQLVTEQHKSLGKIRGYSTKNILLVDDLPGNFAEI